MKMRIAVVCWVTIFAVAAVGCGDDDDRVHPDDLDQDECSYDDECPQGTVCEAGECAELDCDECNYASQGCLITEENPEGTCSVPECRDDEECGEGEFCAEINMCESRREAGEECERDGECGGDLVCSPDEQCDELCFDDVVVGYNTGCTLTCDNRAYCWGWNNNGQAGVGSSENVLQEPTPVAGDHRFEQLSAFEGHVCGIDEGGSVWCWGSDGHDRLGDVVDGSVDAPVEVLADVRDVDVGGSNTCVVVEDGDVYCWGNANGDILGTDADAVQIEAASEHACAISADGTLWCWGRNHTGQLGNGVNTGNSDSEIYGDVGPSEPTPVVAGVDDVVDVSSAGWHTCAATADGSVYCWGHGEFGQLGRELASHYDSTPRTVEGIDDGIGAAAAISHSCALRESGRPVCWGTNHDNNLGDGRGDSLSAPASVSPVEIAW